MASIRLTVDRFEGDGKNIAVLVTEEGATFDLPKSLLPKGIHAGDVLKFVIEKDVEATKAVADETARVQESLTKDDDGGDIKL